MHGANLSFITRGTRIIDLALAYDMMPAQYALTQGHLRTPPFTIVMPEPADAPHWAAACEAAHLFWTRVSSDSHLSGEFRALALENARVVANAADLQRLLPAGG